MTFRSFTSSHALRGILSLFFLSLNYNNYLYATEAIRLGNIIRLPSCKVSPFREAPAFRNDKECESNKNDPINVAMTLDVNYVRGTMAAIFSILQHSGCPEDVHFHFLAAHDTEELTMAIKSTFPYLDFKIYLFDSERVSDKISKSVRQALDQPLNYVRIYLADALPDDIGRVIYLDSDLIVVDDIAKLWNVDMEEKVVAAPEYCNANFTTYFTEEFWKDPELSKTFEGKKACYFNTGVMVMDIEKWRREGYTDKVEGWMRVQKQEKRIYHLGSLPPFLLVLAGNIKGVDHRWNQHGLGGDNFEGKCRSLHPGRISLLHWSGKGKPWLRLDSRKPCSIDHLWAPYDLYSSSKHFFDE